MSQVQQNTQVYGNDIDIRETFIALWKNKHIIVGLALIGAILAGIISVFIFSPVYNSELNIVISMPEKYNTKYGKDYKLPITTNGQYINLITSNDVLINTIKDMEYDSKGVTVENLRDRIKIGKILSDKEVIQNSFDVTISASSPKEAQKLAITLYNNYIRFITVMTNERMVSFYYDSFSVDSKTKEIDLESAKEILKKNEELLAITPQTINQKEAMSQLNQTKDFVVLENIINENYTKIEKDIIENKQLINTLLNTIRVDKENLKELDKEKESIQKYYETGKTKFDATLIGDIVQTSIYLPSDPVEPSHKTSPNNAKNVVIGLIIGGILGSLIALIKEYWSIKA